MFSEVSPGIVLKDADRGTNIAWTGCVENVQAVLNRQKGIRLGSSQTLCDVYYYSSVFTP
ncbi:hypothetical protein ACFLU6_00215 [Acidobacteriota bacterium]